MKAALIKVYKKYKNADEKQREVESELMRTRTELSMVKIMLSNKLSE